MLISEVFDLYRRKENRMGGLATKTDETYANLQTLAIKFFGDIDVATLTDESPIRFYEHLSTWQCPSTVRLNIIAFRKVLKWVKRQSSLLFDPEDIKVPKRQYIEVSYLEPEEIDEFIKAVSRNTRGYCRINRLRNIAIVKVLFSSGIRVNELCKLNKNSIKDRQFISISKSKTPRPCYISEDAEEAIGQYLAARQDNNPALFVANQTGRRMTTANVRNVFHNACNYCELDNVHPHTMRHSMATFLLDRGMGILDVSKLLGHSSVSTTQIYTHVKDRDLRQKYNIYMNLYKGNA